MQTNLIRNQIIVTDGISGSRNYGKDQKCQCVKF